MSYTALYSPLYSRETGRKGAAILDRDQFEALGENTEFGGAVEKARTDTQHRGEYPRTEYEVLHGFKTWEQGELWESQGVHETDISTLGCHYNIERLGWAYGGFEEFWSRVSECCEPFEFVHPVQEHGIDEAGRDFAGDPFYGPDDVEIIHCIADDGDLEVEKLTVGVTDREEVTT